jgi:predicted permease
MARLRAVISRIRGFFSSRRLDSDFQDELSAHLSLLEDENLRRGLPPVEARRQARLRLGADAPLRESHHDLRGLPWLESFLQDVRFGLRMLRKSPGFTAVAVLTLALGIGANTAIFSVVNAVLLRPLPFKYPNRLVLATERFPSFPNLALVISPDFIGWQNNTVFQQMGAFQQAPGGNLTGRFEPEPVSVTRVTTNFFQMLGVAPLLGRTFLPSEGKEAGSHVALLSAALWRSQFAADHHILGKVIVLDRTAYTVVGVMPSSLHYPPGDIWTPMALDLKVFSPSSPSNWGVTVIGRLKQGVAPAEAQADLQVLTKGMDRRYPPQAFQFRANIRAEVAPLHQELVQNVRSLLFILLGSVGLILLIACANVASLLLSRASLRRREIAVRATLGAGRQRLIRQLLTESLLLGTFGCLLGLFAGVFAASLLKQLIPSSLPSEISLDWRTFGFVAALALLATVLFGLAPAFISSLADVNESLKIGPAADRHGALRVRSLLVVAQISLSLVLLAGAGLLARSLLRLTNVHLGFEHTHLLLASAQRPFTPGLGSRQDATFFHQALDRIRLLPGVQSAAIARQVPLAEFNQSAPGLHLMDGTVYRPATDILVDEISPGYFQTMDIPLLKGRSFNESDSDRAPLVVILSESLARGAFKGHDPLGQRVTAGRPDMAEMTVVGVVADTRNSTLDRRPLPYEQQPSSRMTFVVRAAENPRAIASAVRSAVLSVDKNQPLSEVQTMDEIIGTQVAPRQFRVLLVGLFAILALALAAVGVYGVIAYSVSNRTHEIGVRITLGAQRRDVFKFVVGEGMLLAAIGVALGLGAALYATRYAASLLFGVSPRDPLTFGVASIVLFTVALLACYVPARRAMRIDPMVALRHE